MPFPPFNPYHHYHFTSKPPTDFSSDMDYKQRFLEACFRDNELYNAWMAAADGSQPWESLKTVAKKRAARGKCSNLPRAMAKLSLESATTQFVPTYSIYGSSTNHYEPDRMDIDSVVVSRAHSLNGAMLICFVGHSNLFAHQSRGGSKTRAHQSVDQGL